MESILLSNAYILESVQEPSIQEPSSQSTILYANEFSGQSVDIQDDTLEEILNSTIGMSGNNVLVQLKQKMQAYPGGPWYVDSNDGIVHIHNRKYTSETQYVYTYEAEPGEVLSASFKIQEVYKSDTTGLMASIDALTKGISALVNPQVEQPPTYTSSLPTQEEVAKAKERRVLQEKFPHLSEDQVRLSQEGVDSMSDYNSLSAEQKIQAKANRKNQTIQTYQSSSDLVSSLSKSGYSSLISQWDYYKQQCNQYGSSSSEAKQAWSTYQSSASKANVNITSSEDWAYHSFDIWVTSSTQSFTQPPQGEADIKKAVENWKKSHASIIIFSTVQYQKVGTWENVSSTTSVPNISATVTNTIVHWRIKIRITCYSKAKKRYTVPLTSLLGEVSNNISGITAPLAAMKNSVANMGKSRKEKQLQASLRVVGNPELESTQQILIQNVGSKYSGIWYIASVTHSFEHTQGYICDLRLTKQLKKSSMSSTSDYINSTNYTSGSPEDLPSTSSTARSKANRVASDTYTYRDALDEPLTSEEYAYIQAAVNSASDFTGARQTATQLAYNIADVKYYNQTHGTQYTYIQRNGSSLTSNYPQSAYSVVSQRTSGSLNRQVTQILQNYNKPK